MVVKGAMPTDPTHQQPSEQNNTTRGSNDKQSLAIALAIALALALDIALVLAVILALTISTIITLVLALVLVRVLCMFLLILCPPVTGASYFFDSYGYEHVHGASALLAVYGQLLDVLLTRFLFAGGPLAGKTKANQKFCTTSLLKRTPLRNRCKQM